ncbi:MerR family transcriptional regulator [Streptomyces qinzhouensis]|uniref:MerR family transcriptional regulator n=1 Tax=Streptomyces qinzhouensis TaxID=2599401 RepID=A0A5B8IHC2_9ACTN|nr:MerR family transcriptional regulator [Streptomyces qinzhouensis]QDY77662.1 MerR family transcriptional regulator [Streptomyces qinzhouensis]
MEWSIQEVARRAGTTSRTLRHYADIGLLAPHRIGSNGYRYYGPDELVRLQRILLLRELGLGLPAIAGVLAGRQDTSVALRTHLELLELERDRLARRIASVRTTLRKTERGEELMAEDVLDGFDNRQYEKEVKERWGPDAWRESNRRWQQLGEDERRAHLLDHEAIARDYARALKDGAEPGDETAQAVTRRMYAWQSLMTTPSKYHFIGLGEMFAADRRFGDNYDKYGAGTASFVRDAMRWYAERHLTD